MSNVTFKCKTTGNTVTFRDEADIVGMRKHTEYEEVVEQVQLFSKEAPLFSEPEQPAEQSSAAPVAKRGRPSKKV